jgi:predicted dehydrogenase
MMNRREMIKTTAMASAAMALPKMVFAQEKTARLKVGLVGCSGRGMGAITDMMNAAKGSVQIVAIADLFPDRLKIAMDHLEKTKKAFGDSCVDVPQSRQFHGWESYKEILTEDLDIIIHATPPVFRPLHLRAFVDAGKHVFVEKPACVDPVQARELMEIADLADKKRLSMVPGVQRRFHLGYQEAIKRLQDGQIGEVLAAQAYWLNSRFFIQNGGNLFLHNPDPLEMEYQIRNWFIFRWTSGDCYVEQHIHNLDIMRWAFGKDPKDVSGIGGRRWDIEYPALGDRFSHFGVDYDFGEGVHLASYSRRENKSGDHVQERIIGTKGILEMDMGSQRIIGEKPWQASGKIPQCLHEEHRVLIESIQKNEPVNMLRDMVDSTLMAIAGRESAYSGKRIKYDWIKQRSQLSFAPETWSFGKKELNGIPCPGAYQLT